jgi:hypothetical protein
VKEVAALNKGLYKMRLPLTLSPASSVAILAELPCVTTFTAAASRSAALRLRSCLSAQALGGSTLGV